MVGPALATPLAPAIAVALEGGGQAVSGGSILAEHNYSALSTHLPPTSEEDPPQPPTADTLLAYRKAHKKLHASLLKAQSHVGFLSDCADQGIVPKGMRIKKTCNVTASQSTDIGYKLKTLIHRTEMEFLRLAIDHYNQMLDSLMLKIQEHEKRGDAILESSSLLSISVADHVDLLSKTDKNLIKLKSKLADQKNRKLAALTSNSGSRSNVQPPQQDPTKRGLDLMGPGPRRVWLMAFCAMVRVFLVTGHPVVVGLFFAVGVGRGWDLGPRRSVGLAPLLLVGLLKL